MKTVYSRLWGRFLTCRLVFEKGEKWDRIPLAEISNPAEVICNWIRLGDHHGLRI